MSRPVEISYLWDRENMERLFDTSYRYLFDHSAKRYIGWLFIAILQFGVVAALKQGSVAILLFASIVLFYWYYGKRVIAKRRAYRSFERSPFRDKKIAILVDETGFAIKIEEQENFWSWEIIGEVLGMKDDIMLYKAPYFYYIPASAFASIDEKSRFKSMAKSHAKLKA